MLHVRRGLQRAGVVLQSAGLPNGGTANTHPPAGSPDTDTTNTRPTAGQPDTDSANTRPPAGSPNTDITKPRAMAGAQDGAIAKTHQKVWIVSAIAFVLYSADSLIRFARFRTGLDLTIFSQALAQYAHLRAPYVLVKSQQPFNLLGDHFHPVLMLLAPFYRLWPDPRTLLLAQAVLMAIGVHLFTLTAVRRLGPAGYFVGGSFALSWGMLQAVDFDFHEIAFAVPFLALALIALLNDRNYIALAWCVGLVLVKEDSPLLVIGIGLALAASRKWWPALAFVVFGVVSLVVIIGVVIPHFSYSGTYTYLSNTPGTGSITGLLQTGVKSVFGWHGLLFLAALALTAGIGLRSPIILAVLPTLGARIVSGNPAYTGFPYHYNATLMVVCFFALIDGVLRRKTTRRVFLTWPPRWWPAWSLVLLGVVVFGVVRAPTATTLLQGLTPCEKCGTAEQAVEAVPDGVRVAADVYLMTHLVSRTQVMMADPTMTDSTGLPLQAQWIVLDLQSDSYQPGWGQQLLGQLTTSGSWVQTDRFGSFVVLRAV